MNILAIDPGNKQSALVTWDGARIGFKEILPNDAVFQYLHQDWDQHPERLIVEQIRCFGMAVGAEILDTVFWSGRFVDRWAIKGLPWEMVPRIHVKAHLCGTARGTDATVRQALVDRFGDPGTKKAPGFTYGISKDLWAAFALAVTWWDKKNGLMRDGTHAF